MKKIKNIIFDFDGVVHDTLGLAFKINKKINPKLTLDEYKDFFNGNIYGHKKVTDKALRAFFEDQNKEFKKLRINKDIKKELTKIKKQFKMFIVSSNMEVALKNYFDNNLSHVFNEILGMETHKSKIEKFKLLIRKYDLNKSNCVFIADTLGDILEARKAGLDTIAVDYGFHERARLEKGKPIKIVSDFMEILPVIKEINGVKK